MNDPETYLRILRQDEVAARADGLFDWADTVRQMADYGEDPVHWPPWNVIGKVVEDIGWRPEESGVLA